MNARRAALALHEPARGKRYSPALKTRIVEYAQSRRSEGASWVEIAGDIGVGFETLRRWCMAAAPKPSRSMVPVRVVHGHHRVRRAQDPRGLSAR